MRLSDRFAIQALPEVDDVTPVTGRVIVDGVASECVLTGAVLEAAVEWADRFVLILSDGIYWEEGLNIHLLDADLNLMDSLSMGWPYTPGVFSELSLHEPDQLEFCFPSSARWQVHLLSSRQWTVPMPTWLPGVARTGSWWRWIDLVQVAR
jgi:hypothetical protein